MLPSLAGVPTGRPTIKYRGAVSLRNMDRQTRSGGSPTAVNQFVYYCCGLESTTGLDYSFYSVEDVILSVSKAGIDLSYRDIHCNISGCVQSGSYRCLKRGPVDGKLSVF